MNLWHEFMNDPVIFISFTGLAIVLGLCTFYAVYFIYKISHAGPDDLPVDYCLIAVFSRHL